MAKQNLVIVGNWKMNKTPQETKTFMKEFTKLYKKNEDKIGKATKFGLAVPSVNLSTMKEHKVKPSMIVAAENMHQQDTGAFTGELSAMMVKAAGANAVVIGHSERRQFFNETDQDVNEKVKQALEHKLLPIMCIGETLEERQARKWKPVLSAQLKKGLKGILADNVSKIVIAYEPIWAIGTGVTASSAEAQEACAYVRTRIKALFSEEAAKKINIQYGGSVKPANVQELMSQPDINGALVGGASLEAESFIKLLTLNQ